jgi:hypothetical protein
MSLTHHSQGRMKQRVGKKKGYKARETANNTKVFQDRENLQKRSSCESVFYLCRKFISLT